VVDLLKTKRWWIIIMQLLIGAGLGGVALTIPVPAFFKYTLVFFWLLAFSSATHDIAADGFYMLGLEEHKQAYFIGIRSTFYRLAMITGQGLLIILAGSIESNTGLKPLDFEVRTQQQNTACKIPENQVLIDSLQGEKYFIIQNSTIRLGNNKITPENAGEVKKWAHSQNISNSFVEEDKTLANSPSWWSRNVSEPLKLWLKKVFGRDRLNANNNNLQGNIAVVGISLSEAPERDKTIVLNLDRKKGDKDLSIVEGHRLSFTSQNWNKQAWVLVQADAKLDRITDASFRGLSGDIPFAWSVTFFVLAGLFVVFFVYHRFALPKVVADKAVAEGRNMVKEFFNTFASFFTKRGIGVAIFFILLFRLGESQLVKLAAPFLLDARDVGGLGLTTGDVGLIYGTIGIIALTVGGILGGWLASRNGLKYWIWWMALAMNLPNLTYVYLSIYTPSSIWLIASSVAIEQFGYGFGFTAFMLFLINFSEGKSKTAHYAISTGLMALGMMIPGMFSGWLQEIVGYQSFFIWVMLCTIPGFVVIRFLKIDPAFGIKKSED